jgi:hypothetical protein
VAVLSGGVGGGRLIGDFGGEGVDRLDWKFGGAGGGRLKTWCRRWAP